MFTIEGLSRLQEACIPCCAAIWPAPAAVGWLGGQQLSHSSNEDFPARMFASLLWQIVRMPTNHLPAKNLFELNSSVSPDAAEASFMG